MKWRTLEDEQREWAESQRRTRKPWWPGARRKALGCLTVGALLLAAVGVADCIDDRRLAAELERRSEIEAICEDQADAVQRRLERQISDLEAAIEASKAATLLEIEAAKAELQLEIHASEADAEQARSKADEIEMRLIGCRCAD